MTLQKLIRNSLLLLVVFAINHDTAIGQNQLPAFITLQEALAIGLESNFLIKIASNEEKIAANNNNRGAAGFYPTIIVGADQNNTVSNADLVFGTGDELSVRGAFATSFAANVGISWQVFDGFARSATLRRFGNEYQLAGHFKRAEMEMVMSNIIKAYISLALQEKLVAFTRENLEISRARRNLAIQREAIGAGSGSSVLQSRLDFNNDSLNYYTQNAQINVLKHQLLNQLQVNAPINFEVDTGFFELLTLDYDRLRNDVIDQNRELIISRLEILNAQETVKEQKGQLYPDVFINSGANYNLGINPANFVTQNINYGPFIGVSANYMLYDGNNIKRNIQNAKLLAENSRIAYEQALTSSAIELNTLIAQHEALKGVESILQQNIEISKENLEIAIEQYRLGAITDVEFREIQIKTIQTNFEMVQNELEKKLLEADMLRITGNLITD